MKDEPRILTVGDLKQLLPATGSHFTLKTHTDFTTASGEVIKAGATVAFRITNVSHKKGYVGMHFDSLTPVNEGVQEETDQTKEEDHAQQL